MRLRFWLLLLSIVLLWGYRSKAQVSANGSPVKLTLDQADALFVKNNFQLLAAQYRINEADAAVIQSRLYPNPVLSVDQGAYNKDNKKWFDISKNGQTQITVQQLIVLAGKRNKSVQLAKINSSISTAQFSELIRTLRYQLHAAFYNLYYLNETIKVYDRELDALSSLVQTYSDQYTKGNISFKDLARLQALQFSLQNEKLDLISQTADNQSTLTLLTGDTVNINPVPDGPTREIQSVSTSLNYQQMVDTALTNRGDYIIAEQSLNFAQVNQRLQKALAIPDIALGVNYDRQGSYIRDYNSAQLQVAIPLFNRNQGNIKMAGFMIDENKQLLSDAQLRVKTDINKALIQLIEAEKLIKQADGRFSNDYDKLFNGIITAYTSHTISLLEFIDFIETYKDSKSAYNRLKYNWLESIENINLATGTVYIK